MAKNCGIIFNCKYHIGYTDVSVPGYVQKVLENFQHQPPKSLKFSPFAASTYVKDIKVQRQYAPKMDSY